MRLSLRTDRPDASPPPLAGEDQGGGSRRQTKRPCSCAFDNLSSPRDPPPLPAPTRGGGAPTIQVKDNLLKEPVWTCPPRRATMPVRRRRWRKRRGRSRSKGSSRPRSTRATFG